MVKNRLASTLLERAMAFYQARLWTSYTGDEVVKLVLPEDHPALIASIMGHDEPPQGLNTYLGARALEDCAEILGSNKSHYEDHTDCYLLGFGIDRLASIPGVQREVLEAAGFKGRREALAPWFYAKSPAGSMRNPSRKEQRILLSTINAILLAVDEGTFEPLSLYAGRLFTLDVTGTPFELHVASQIQDIPVIERVARDHVHGPGCSHDHDHD